MKIYCVQLSIRLDSVLAHTKYWRTWMGISAKKTSMGYPKLFSKKQLTAIAENNSERGESEPKL